MPRKTKAGEPQMYEDKPSPLIAGSSEATKPAPSGIANAGQKKAPISKPAPKTKTATVSAKQAAKKATAVASQRAPNTPGVTVVKNPIDLSEKEQKALELAALHGLDARQAKFCDLWLMTYDGRQSYRDAGYKCKNDNVASAGASKLLKKVKHHPYMKARQVELFARTADIQNQIIAVVHAASFADPRELVTYVRRCCRYCYGKGFKRQFKPSEMETRREEYEAAALEIEKAGQTPEPFDELGGLGYDAKKPPHPNCPECSGEGYGHALFKDIENLPAASAALALYEGVEEGKDGTKMRIASQKGYRELLARLYDMGVEPQVTVTAGVSKEELEEVLAKAEAKTNAGREEMLERERALANMGQGGASL